MSTPVLMPSPCAWFRTDAPTGNTNDANANVSIVEARVEHACEEACISIETRTHALKPAGCFLLCETVAQIWRCRVAELVCLFPLFAARLVWRLSCCAGAKKRLVNWAGGMFNSLEGSRMKPCDRGDPFCYNGWKLSDNRFWSIYICTANPHFPMHIDIFMCRWKWGWLGRALYLFTLARSSWTERGSVTLNMTSLLWCTCQAPQRTFGCWPYMCGV